jgi:ribosomal protein S27E
MYKNDTVERMITESGECHAVTIPGMYTLIYFNSKDEVLCSGCATKIATDIVAVRTYDEGSKIDCTDCGKVMESSYGDPEEEEEVKTPYSNPEDFWYYGNKGLIMCCIDDIRDLKHSSAQYLMENKGMSLEEAYAYVNNIRHL